MIYSCADAEHSVGNHPLSTEDFAPVSVPLYMYTCFVVPFNYIFVFLLLMAMLMIPAINC